MKYLILACTLLLSIDSFCQVGIGTTNPHASSALDIHSNSKGLLPPRLTELEMNAIVNPAEGLFIYNLDNNCFKYFKGSNWSNCLGEVVSNILDCNSLQIGGDYVVSQPLTSAHTLSIDVLVNVIEPYSITTNIINGYSFSASGNFSNIGVNTITLTASGTPLAIQTDSFNINLNNDSCTNTNVMLNKYN